MSFKVSHCFNRYFHHNWDQHSGYTLFSIHSQYIMTSSQDFLLAWTFFIIFYLHHHSSLAVEILHFFMFHSLKEISAPVFMNESNSSMVFIDLFVIQLHNRLLKIDDISITFALSFCLNKWLFTHLFALCMNFQC